MSDYCLTGSFTRPKDRLARVVITTTAAVLLLTSLPFVLQSHPAYILGKNSACSVCSSLCSWLVPALTCVDFLLALLRVFRAPIFGFRDREQYIDLVTPCISIITLSAPSSTSAYRAIYPGRYMDQPLP